MQILAKDFFSLSMLLFALRYIITELLACPASTFVLLKRL